MLRKPKIGVLLSGSGVYDGSEIHEAVLSLLVLDKRGAEIVCIAPDKQQHHVVNHLTGEEMQETRNVLVESARIARGAIQAVDKVKVDDLDGLLMPGGFGAAKNLSSWAFDGPAAQIDAGVKSLIQELVKLEKPIASVCISPVVLAKAFEGSNIKPLISVGTTTAKSPYDIAATHEALQQTGVQTQECATGDILVDEKHKIITSPCYMMDVTIAQVYVGVERTIDKLLELVHENVSP